MIASFLNAAEPTRLKWDELPPLPPAPGQVKQPGVAGPYVGVHRDALLVAGGANFPVKPPWEGGAKSWRDDIFVLVRDAKGAFRWIIDATNKLPRPIGYGMSFSTTAGVVCVGGADNDQCHRDTFILTWNPTTRKVETETLVPLPRPLAFMAGVMIGSTIFVAGGQHTVNAPELVPCFWALDLSRRGRPEFGWKELPPWPGPARIVPVAAAQSNGTRECFYLFSGRLPRAGLPTTILTDAYAFDPGRREWTTLSNVNGFLRGGGDGWSVMAGTAGTAGPHEILIFGGSRGHRFMELEGYDLKIAALRRQLAAPGADAPALQRQIDACLQAKVTIYENHPGFSRDVLAYDTRGDTWRVAGQMPVSSPVTTLAVRWGNAWVIPSGEEKPGIRTPRVLRVTIEDSMP